MYGKRGGNGFIAIPDWSVCVEAAQPSDVFYNTERLSQAKSEIIADNAHELALAVKALFS